jgi:hypothetical protein
LAKPGTVIKRPRGTEAEQIAALSPSKGRNRRSEGKSEARRKAVARPGRGRLDAAADALDRAKARHKAENDELEKQEVELARRKRALEEGHRREIARLERIRDKARSAHAAALEKWRGRV